MRRTRRRPSAAAAASTPPSAGLAALSPVGSSEISPLVAEGVPGRSSAAASRSAGSAGAADGPELRSSDRSSRTDELDLSGGSPFRCQSILLRRFVSTSARKISDSKKIVEKHRENHTI